MGTDQRTRKILGIIKEGFSPPFYFIKHNMLQNIIYWSFEADGETLLGM